MATESLVERLRKRAEIRRQIPSRKAVQEGKPDRLADLLDEAADALDPFNYDNMEWANRVRDAVARVAAVSKKIDPKTIRRHDDVVFTQQDLYFAMCMSDSMIRRHGVSNGAEEDLLQIMEKVVPDEVREG